MTNFTGVGQKAKKHNDKHVGVGQQTARPGFVRIGSPKNASEIIAQQNVDWMKPENL